MRVCVCARVCACVCVRVCVYFSIYKYISTSYIYIYILEVDIIFNFFLR